jgi:hypothetical protein
MVAEAPARSRPPVGRRWLPAILILELLFLAASFSAWRWVQVPQCPQFHTWLALSGTPERVAHLSSVCHAVPNTTARSVLRRDLLLAACYVAALALPLMAASWQSWRTGRSRWRLLAAAVAAGVLDCTENVLLLAALAQDGSLGVDSPWALLLAAVAAWWKFVLFTIAALGCLWLLVGSYGYRGTSDAEPVQESPAAGETGICLSGGGIRAAAFALGGMRALDRQGRFHTARWLTAVSGGAYTGGAWYLARSAIGEEPSSPRPYQSDRGGGWVDGLLQGVEGAAEILLPNRYGYIHQHRRYLAASRGGTPASVLLLLCFLVVHLSLLFALLWLLARPLGWLVGSWVVQPGLRNCGWTDDCRVGAPARLMLPGAVVLGLAAVPLLRSLFTWEERRRSLVRTGLALAAAGAALLALLVVVPLAMDEVPGLLARIWTQLPATDQKERSADVNAAARLLQLLSAVGLVGALVRLLTHRLTKAAPRLGGVLLGLLIVLLSGELATDAARLGPGGKPGIIGGRLTDAQSWAALLAGFALAYLVLNQRWWSPHTIFKRRLRTTFATTTRANLAQRGWAGDTRFGVYPLRSRVETDQRTWDRYPEHQPAVGDQDDPGTGPELVICAAVQRNGRDVTGVPALSFVFSPSGVGFHEPGPDGKAWMVKPERFVKALPGWGWFANSQGTVSNAIALTGAAFTSAMGRQSLGTTNALLAALNLRLGVWLPNPRRIPATGGRRFGVPRLS